MTIEVHFYSYFRELAGTASAVEELPAGSTLGELYTRLAGRFPRLAAMRNSTLMAVGVDYQGRDYVLQAGNVVSLFPPVQGG